MDANDGADLKIWVTEYGLPTTNRVSEAQQAAFIHDFVVKGQSIDGAGPIFIYTTQDTRTGEDEENFGIFHTDWTPKAAAVKASPVAKLRALLHRPQPWLLSKKMPRRRQRR